MTRAEAIEAAAKQLLNERKRVSGMLVSEASASLVDYYQWLADALALPKENQCPECDGVGTVLHDDHHVDERLTCLKCEGSGIYTGESNDGMSMNERARNRCGNTTDLESLKKMLEEAIQKMGKTTHKDLLPKLSVGQATLIVRDEMEAWFYFDTDGNLQSVRVYND